MQREPFIVQTWSEESGALVPIETISFETIEQANRVAAFAARRRTGVIVYRAPSRPNGERIVLSRLGRVPSLARA